MADKSTRAIVEALGRACAEPNGIPMYSGKAEAGLFPAGAKTREIATRCLDEGLLAILRTEFAGKQSREICGITDKGRDFLLQQSSPREILEDFLRLLEARRGEVAQLAERVESLSGNLAGMKTLIERLQPRPAHPIIPSRNGTHMEGSAMNGIRFAPPLPKATSATDALIAEIKTRLAEWHAGPAAAQDCPLPELFRKLELEKPASIGQFHDALRLLCDDQQIYLHPWTGPLYQMPEPVFALLIGHEIAYYAAAR